MPDDLSLAQLERIVERHEIVYIETSNGYKYVTPCMLLDLYWLLIITQILKISYHILTLIHAKSLLFSHSCKITKDGKYISMAS